MKYYGKINVNGKCYEIFILQFSSITCSTSRLSGEVYRIFAYTIIGYSISVSKDIICSSSPLCNDTFIISDCLE